MKERFIKFKCSQSTKELLKAPHCFVLLAQISTRAKRTDLFSIHNLKKGEALLGDYKNVGLTRQMYRNALKKLVKWQFVTTQATNRGTVVKLINTSVFDINFFPSNHPDNHQTTIRQPSDNHQTTIRQPSDNHQTTTNKKEKKEKKEKNKDFKDKDKVINAIKEKKQIIQEKKQRKLLNNEKISITKAYKNKAKGEIDPKVKVLIKKIGGKRNGDKRRRT